MTISSIAQSIAKINHQLKTVEAAMVRKAYPKITRHVEQILVDHSLTAAAARGRLPLKTVDDALARKPLSTADRMAIKLKLQWAGVI